MKRFSILAAFLLAACGHSAPEANLGLAPRSGTLPGGVPAAAHGPSATVVNGDFEQTASDGGIPGWATAQHAGPVSYAMRIDPEGAYAGHGSFHMTRTLPQVYGTLTQNLDARPYAGKTVELSAMLKTRGVGPRGWKLLASLPGTVAYSTGMTGDTAWARESLRLSVPTTARQLTIGVILLDAGDGWMDDVTVKTVD